MDLNSYKDSIHYITGYKIELLMKNKNHNHVIVYGIPMIGKSTLIKLLFNDIYNISYKKTYLSFPYEMNKNYYYFNLKIISQKKDLILYIKEIFQTFDHNNYKYIIIDHFEELNKKYQNILKVIIEKGINNIKLFIITNKYNKIIHPIISRCFSIRIKAPIVDGKYFFNDLSSNIIDSITDDFIHIIHGNITLLNAEKIRKLSEKIKELNIPFNVFFKRIIEKNNREKIKILKYITEYEYLHLKSYRPLIYIEALILKLNELIFNNYA